MDRNDYLDVDVIKEGLQNGGIGGEAVVYESTSSTNDIAWEYSGKGMFAVFAEEQTAGRGRGGNKWLSDKGESILCSVLLGKRKCGAELLTLAAAIAVAEVMVEHCGLDAKIKWPNDVMVKGKKIAGILLESRVHNDGSEYVAGIGINCHQQKDFFEECEPQMPATSTDIETGRRVERNLLAPALLGSIYKWAEAAEKDSERVVAKWQQMSSQLGHRVTVRCNRKDFTGNCIGVDPVRGLVLQLEHGGVRMFDAAHTTIIKHLQTKQNKMAGVSENTNGKLVIHDCGLTRYKDAMRFQAAILEHRQKGDVPNTVLLLEHKPVVTFGARESENKLRVSREVLAANGIDLETVSRGGGSTAHNPGQIIVYPILDLKSLGFGVSDYIRRLEAVGIELLEQFGIKSARKKGFPGLWVGERKIGSVGVKVKKFVTLHGMAININNDLSIFENIVPCGLEGVEITNVQKETGREISMSQIKQSLAELCREHFSIKDRTEDEEHG